MKPFDKYKIISIVPVISLPITMISCINNKDKDTLIFKIPYYKNNDIKPFYNVIEVYNTYLESKNDPHLPVAIEESKNRNLIYQKINLDLSSQNEFIPNLILYYPSLANILNSYHRSLNFHEIIDDSNIDKNFLITEKQVNTSKDENILLPFSVSGESLVINNILFGMFLDQALTFLNNENEQQISLDYYKHRIFINALNCYQKASGPLKNTTEKFWKSQKIVFNKNKLLDLFATINDQQFRSNFGLINLAKKISDTFSQEENKISIETLHIRSINNFVYSLLFNYSKTSYDNYFLKRKPNGLLDYDKIFEIGSEENNQLKWVFEYIKSSLMNSKISLYNSANDSSPFISTKMFALTSTRFYQLIENDKNKKIKEFQFLPAPTKNDINDKVGSFLVQGNNLIGIKKSKVQDESTINFVNWMYNKNNIINWKIGPKILKLTPVEYIAYSLGYIFPSENFIKEFPKMNKINLANQKFLVNAKRKDLSPFQEPVDKQSDSLRKNIALVFSNYLYNNLETANFSEFLFNLKKGIFGE
ncbi:hypothetical protein DA803_00405 [[Mycoplasma] phocae]|uniref:Mycoplasma lipoprotein C-terminal domain-containing protein n=1 Tax=[Mycoplasma] phocae TaxID=142651 RepID=A0A2Z5IPZ0_9BACT|nr:hypothetical protein [[Mycoplasma] phocae]AXE60562.1 hypothetical protein DA803_00405 [[Mycoplasma] phocae]